MNNLNSDLVKKFPDYVCRVTADEADIGRGHLSRFQDVESQSPVILTTSQLLTTGVDAPTCKNIVLARVVGSMTEFKQIIGRGTRVRDDYGKLWFNILDYTGSATRLFADPEFDGEPAFISEEEIDSAGKKIKEKVIEDGLPESEGETFSDPIINEGPDVQRRKYYFDEGQVEIVSHLVYELDPDGKQLRVVKFADYAGEKVRTLYPSAPELRSSGPTRQSAPASFKSLPNEASALMSWPLQRTNPTLILSTFSATSHSTRRFAPTASEPNGCTKRRKTSSTTTDLKHAKC